MWRKRSTGWEGKVSFTVSPLAFLLLVLRSTTIGVTSSISIQLAHENPLPACKSGQEPASPHVPRVAIPRSFKFPLPGPQLLTSSDSNAHYDFNSTTVF
jgi:hypothetical protein